MARGACGRSSSSCATTSTTQTTCGTWPIDSPQLMQPVSRVSKVLGPMFGRTTEDDYQVGREVSATSRAMARLAQHPEEALRLVDLARQERANGSPRIPGTSSTAPRTAVFERADAQGGRGKFLELVANPERLGELLRRLHELGVLEKIIPEFSHARSLLQFNQYHKYTVDEHCIRSVEEVTHFAERDGCAGRRVPRISRTSGRCTWRCFVHDLGKGRTRRITVWWGLRSPARRGRAARAAARARRKRSSSSCGGTC